jgi:hypothetical protein
MTGMNGAKISKIWGSLLLRRGYRILVQGFNPELYTQIVGGNKPSLDAPKSNVA